MVFQFYCHSFQETGHVLQKGQCHESFTLIFSTNLYQKGVLREAYPLSITNFLELDFCSFSITLPSKYCMYLFALGTPFVKATRGHDNKTAYTPRQYRGLGLRVVNNTANIFAHANISAKLKPMSNYRKY